MGLNTLIHFIIFYSLCLFTLVSGEDRRRIFSRSKTDWILDGSGLIIQGLIIPLIPFVLVPLIHHFFPGLQGKYNLNNKWQFILSFIVIDYIYYWNHRLFHQKSFWHLHRLHHSSTHLDLFSTSRNSLITSAFFIYLWSQIGGMLVLKDHSGFMLGLTLTYSLDLWRHSGFKTPQLIKPTLSWFFILPEDHVLHHSLLGRNKNFGANLSWWDRLHGTYSDRSIANEKLDRNLSVDPIKALVHPRRVFR